MLHHDFTTSLSFGSGCGCQHGTKQCLRLGLFSFTRFCGSGRKNGGGGRRKKAGADAAMTTPLYKKYNLEDENAVFYAACCFVKSGEFTSIDWLRRQSEQSKWRRAHNRHTFKSLFGLNTPK